MITLPPGFMSTDTTIPTSAPTVAKKADTCTIITSTLGGILLGILGTFGAWVWRKKRHERRLKEIPLNNERRLEEIPLNALEQNIYEDL